MQLLLTMGNIMNGSNACAFKITFVTKVSQEDWVHVYYGKLPYEMVFFISATPGQKNAFFQTPFSNNNDSRCHTCIIWLFVWLVTSPCQGLFPSLPLQKRKALGTRLSSHEKRSELTHKKKIRK